MTLATRQAVLARFVDDADFEQEVRSHPDRVAVELNVDQGYVRWLARLPHNRVAAFRASQRVKERRRRQSG